MNQLQSQPVKTGLVTAENCKRLVCIGPIWFFVSFGIMRTGLSLSLRHLRPKTKTGPDFQTLDGEEVWAGVDFEAVSMVPVAPFVY